jgi:hypothetical protein
VNNNAKILIFGGFDGVSCVSDMFELQGKNKVILSIGNAKQHL